MQPRNGLPNPDLSRINVLPKLSAVHKPYSVCARPSQRLVEHSFSYEHVRLKPAIRLLPQDDESTIINFKQRPSNACQGHHRGRHISHGHRLRPRPGTSMHATYPLSRPPFRRPGQSHDDGLDAADGPSAGSSTTQFHLDREWRNHQGVTEPIIEHQPLRRDYAGRSLASTLRPPRLREAESGSD